MKFVVPGYKYLGPGNTLDRGSPVNEVDAIALQHDIEYNRAKNQEDILNSDHRAISKFKNQLIKNPSIGAALGTGGLGIKHFIESSIGNVIYPSNLGR